MSWGDVACVFWVGKSHATRFEEEFFPSGLRKGASSSCDTCELNPPAIYARNFIVSGLKRLADIFKALRLPSNFQ